MALIPRLMLTVASLSVPVAAAAADGGSTEVLIGPQTVQSLVEQQLFTRQGRFYLQDDGPCYAYLQSPHTRLKSGRLYLDAHLSSHIGVQAFGDCTGVSLASNVTLSTAIQASGTEIHFTDIRVEKVQDSDTPATAEVLQQVLPGLVPRLLKYDLAALFNAQVSGVDMHLDYLKILSLQTSPGGIAARLDLKVSSR